MHQLLVELDLSNAFNSAWHWNRPRQQACSSTQAGNKQTKIEATKKRAGQSDVNNKGKQGRTNRDRDKDNVPNRDKRRAVAEATDLSTDEAPRGKKVTDASSEESEKFFQSRRKKKTYAKIAGAKRATKGRTGWKTPKTEERIEAVVEVKDNNKAIHN